MSERRAFILQTAVRPTSPRLAPGVGSDQPAFSERIFVLRTSLRRVRCEASAGARACSEPTPDERLELDTGRRRQRASYRCAFC